MITKIFVRDKFRTVKPEHYPKEIRELDSFLVYNKSDKNIIKAQGGYYRVSRQGGLAFIVRALYLLSFKEWLEISLNDNFIANIK